MTFKANAKFVRVNGDIYRNCEAFADAGHIIGVSDAEARAHFEAQGADLEALGLADVAPLAPENEAPKPKRGRSKNAVSGDAPIDLEELFGSEDGKD